MGNRTPVLGTPCVNSGSSQNHESPNLESPILGNQNHSKTFRHVMPEMGVNRRKTLHSPTSVSSRNFRQNVSNVSDASPLIQSTSFDHSRQTRPTSSVSSSLNKSGTFTLTKTGQIVGNGISQRQHSINSPKDQQLVQQFNLSHHNNQSPQNLYNTLQ